MKTYRLGMLGLVLILVATLLIHSDTSFAQGGPEPGQKITVTVWSDDKCVSQSTAFTIPAGWMGTEVRSSANTSFSPCSPGAGHTDRVGYQVTGPVSWARGVKWGGGTYGDEVPDTLLSGSYQMELGMHGRRDSFELTYVLQPEGCAVEEKSVAAWSDGDCMGHSSPFVIPAGCTATDLRAETNTSFMPCSPGAGHTDRVGYQVTGPVSWQRGVEWGGGTWGDPMPTMLPSGSYEIQMAIHGKLDSWTLHYTLRPGGGPGGPPLTPTVITVGGSGTLDDLDLIFCIDVTGSMEDDIDSVKAAASSVVNAVATKNENYRVAIIAYRDWDDSAGLPMFEDYGFSSDKEAIISNINSLSVGGGDDTPEAVFEALMRAIDSTSVGTWRHNVNKQVILMGDAPPHNPSREGYTPAIVAQAAEDADPVVIQALVVGNSGVYDEDAVAAFRELAQLTGGSFFEAADSSKVPEVLQKTIAVIEVPKPPNLLSQTSVLLIGGLCLVGVIFVVVVIVAIVLLSKPRRATYRPMPPGGMPGYGPRQAPPPPPASQPHVVGGGELVLLRGQAQPAGLLLSLPLVRLGRSQQGNHAVIQDPRVSGAHAEIYAQGGGHTICDLRSTNGTYVNGARVVQPQPLRDGDRIVIGSTEWVYRHSGGTMMMPR